MIIESFVSIASNSSHILAILSSFSFDTVFLISNMQGLEEFRIYGC